jgi:aminoglycoside phosphotransferase (APT) family kinase protein
MTQLFYEYRMMRQEPEIHSIVRERTSVPIPEIRAHDFSRSKIDRDYLIMPRIPGKPLSEAGLSLEAAERAHRRWGEYTEQLHNLTAGANEFGYSGAHRPMEPKSSWADAFFEMYRLELEDIRRLGVYDKGKFDYALDLLRERLAVFDNVAAPVMCHGDLWVTNLLVRPGGEVTALIDFDRACWGDPEWDLAIADYCGVTTGAFLSGYGGDPRTAAGVSREAAELRRTFYILYEHQKYIVISLSARRNDPAGARRYAEQSLRMMRQL